MMSAAVILSHRPPPTASLRAFSVDEYHHLIATGFFAKDEAFELLQGHIVRKMPKDPIHETIVLLARRILSEQLPAGWHMRVQSPLTLTDSEPEPDVMVVEGDELSYPDRHPAPAQVPLVIEVSNSTLSDDRNWKASIYANNQVQHYWIINLIDWRIEVFSQPSDSDGRYLHVEKLASGETVRLTLPESDRSIAVDELLPPRLRPRRS